MSKYRITIEGKTYEMEVEFIDENTADVPDTKKTYREFRNSAADPMVRVMDPSAQKQTVNNPGVVFAPMPGTVIKLFRQEGDTVKTGDVVLILEAMKMENEILAPADGVIKNMACREGQTAAGGDVLFEIG